MYFGTNTLSLYRPLSITPHTYQPLYGSWSMFPAHDVVKGYNSTSEDVSMHSLGYKLPRTPFLGTGVNKGKGRDLG